MSGEEVSATGSSGSTQAANQAAHSEIKSRYGVNTSGYTEKEVKALDEGFDQMLLNPITATLKKMVENEKKRNRENA